MTPEKVKEVITLYRKKFVEMGIPKEELSKDRFPERVSTTIVFTPEYHHHLAHCHSKLDWLEVLIQKGRIREAHRLLGFIQSILWTANIYTLDEIAAQNRMPGPWWSCKECGSEEQERRNVDVVAREADVYCKSCGAFVREWNP